VFDENALWNDQPPASTDWMHRLGIDENSLDGGTLLSSVETLFNREGQ